MKWLSNPGTTVFIQSMFISFMVIGLLNNAYLPLLLGAVVSIVHSFKLLVKAVKESE